MNIRDLQYFLAVAQLGHFGKAAEQSHVSQPTLSGQIKKLESQLGVTLFERNNRKVMLTETGEQIVVFARRILREVNAIEDIAESAHDPLSGKFRLGAFPTLASYIFPSLVPKIKKNMPDLRLILIEEKTHVLIEKLVSGSIDAAFLALPVNNNFLKTQKVFEDEFFLAVPKNHSLAKYKKIDQSKLKDHQLLLLEEGHCLRDQSLEVCSLYNIAEEQDFKATSLETLRQMVRAGTGLTFVPEIAIPKKEDDNIRYIPFKSPVPMRSIGLVWGKTSSKQEVINHLVDCFKI